MDFRTIQEWEEHMARQAAKSKAAPKTIKYTREKIFSDPFALQNAKALEAMFNQQKPDYTEWRDPNTQKITMVVPRDFFDSCEEMFNNLPDVEIT